MTIEAGGYFGARERGLTLAEALMATVALSIAAAGVLLPFASGARVRAEGVHRTLGTKLASDLMEEIVGTPFDQIIALYDGYCEPQGQLKDAAGEVFADPAYAKFSSDVSCVSAYVPQESGVGAPRFILITVQVYRSGKKIATIDRLVSE